MIDLPAFHMLLLSVTNWLDRRKREVLAYLIEENRVLRKQMGGRRFQLSDDERRRLATRAYRLGRRTVREVATIVTPFLCCAVGHRTGRELLCDGAHYGYCAAQPVWRYAASLAGSAAICRSAYY